MVDVMVSHGIVSRVGKPGASASWHPDEGSLRIDGTGLMIIPGMVDIHTHIFGSSGLRDADSVGIDSAVPVIADAGGSGTSTVGDLLDLCASPAQTQLLAFLSLEAGGTDTSRQFDPKRPFSSMTTSSIDQLFEAAERYTSFIGIKVWATPEIGERWIDYAAMLSDVLEKPLMLYLNSAKSPDLLQGELVAECLDRLQEGDIVTHCFNGTRNALIDAAGRVRPEVVAARGRGVLFDSAPGGRGLSFARAISAISQGWLPDILSTGAREHGNMNDLPTVMSMFMAMGMSLEDVVAAATLKPATAIGASVGRPLEGEVGTLSLLRQLDAPTMFTDRERGSILGDTRLEPVGCFIEGNWHDASHRQERARVPDGESASEEPIERFIDAIRAGLSSIPDGAELWRGDHLQRMVNAHRAEMGTSSADALRELHTRLGSPAGGLPIGWVLEALGPNESLRRLARSFRPVGETDLVPAG